MKNRISMNILKTTTIFNNSFSNPPLSFLHLLPLFEVTIISSYTHFTFAIVACVNHSYVTVVDDWNEFSWRLKFAILRNSIPTLFVTFLNFQKKYLQILTSKIKICGFQIFFHEESNVNKKNYISNSLHYFFRFFVFLE